VDNVMRSFIIIPFIKYESGDKIKGVETVSACRMRGGGEQRETHI
jgi:hypothetical protein